MREEFTFNGVHCDAHSVAFVVTSWPVAATPSINKFSIPGRHGTLRYRGTWLGEQRLEGIMYLLSTTDEVISYADMLSRKTGISAWLRPGGRKQLILDAAPDRFYMAEIEDELTISTDEWGNGCIPITFTLQPFAYAITSDSTTTATLAANTGTSMTLSLRGNSAAPIAMELTANATLTWAQLTLNGSTFRLEGMLLSAGQKVLISFDLDTGEVMSITCAGAAGMRYLAASSPACLEARPGANTITAKADAACSLTLSARGRWQ